jgi:triosephosphate isomerase
MRRRLIAGNWKMNGSRASLVELDAIAAAADVAPGVDVAICPPFTLIERAAARQPGLAIGGQDCHAEAKGAHTGCVAAAMLVEAGASMVIVGHSERRCDQHETDADVKAKAEAAIAAGLIAIVCCGETADHHRAGETEAVVSGQLRGSLPVAGGDVLVVAYEPIWAIGTGLTPTAADVAAVHATIRGVLIELLGADRADGVRILYGGSVNAGNAAELLAVPDVDGALVGGASLAASAFVPIIEAAAH